MSDHEFDRKAFDERDPGELLAAVAQLLDREANAMPIPPWSGAPRHLIMTIVPRRGFTVVGVDERRWLSGWYYSNHATAALTSDIAVVTEHGWTEFMSGWGGREPKLELAA